VTLRTRYAALGILLSVGSPAGLLVLRTLAAPNGDWRHFSTYRGEIRRAPLVYGYLTVATALAFGIFGMRLGALADNLQRTSTTDSLTGLHNARAFGGRLREAVVRAARYGERLSVLLVDVDHLKTLNDSRGHSAGNASLQAVADAFRRTLRSADMSFRWGGDEFAVLAPHTSENEAVQIAERIVEAVAHARTDGAALSVSIGVATLVPDPHDIATSTEHVVRQADAALYRAKQEGRGCFRTAQLPLTVAGNARAL
jgi:diguanylate cyclase (GGDEF)-like protein